MKSICIIQMSHNHMGHDHAAHMDHHMDHTTTSSADTTMDMDMGDMVHDECSTMSHGGHSMMVMSFHAGYCETVLFDGWKVSSIGSLIGSMVGIFFLAMFYEGLKYYREYLFWKTYNSLQYRAVSVPAEKGVVAEDNRIVHKMGPLYIPPELQWQFFASCFPIVSSRDLVMFHGPLGPLIAHM
ncbi:high affinity copper uptake protein 1 isoform X5 [Periplaneta americana]|uniref:high affinity copper uptake protein 1 isoform X5 n=1 Tax=Periplaneta americana TaxID=6978 RepID=UPI0037E844EA